MSIDHNRVTPPAIRLLLILLLVVNTSAVPAETFRHERGVVGLEQIPQRIVALNWAAAEALLLLGITPTGVADLDGYPVWVQKPMMPESVRNVGTRGWQLVTGAVGGGTVLVFLFALSRKHRFAGHQLLLGGIAIYIMMDALMRLVLASGGTDAAKLLTWLMGSTWQVTEQEALLLAAAAAGLMTLTALAVRVLSILPLGDASASALGLRVVSARGLLLLLASLLTATATVVIGPLSFVGLMAPHLARMLGQQPAGKQLILAGLIGATLLALADYLAQVVIFPNQLPAGLLAAIVGGVYFLWGMTRQGRQ